MPNAHSEVEVKLAACEVKVSDFVAYCATQHPERYLHVIGPDEYYRRGDFVVRHRHDPALSPAGELTVKRRRSATSTMNRLEVDLRFAAGTGIEDVEEFLDASGWEHQMTLTKDAHIFWFVDEDGPVTVVLYDVYLNRQRRDSRRFLEVEAEKGTQVGVRAAKSQVRRWLDRLRVQFPSLSQPLNQSLYELYSEVK